jgi:hypothetical protein
MYLLFLQERVKERSARPKDTTQITSTSRSFEVTFVTVHFVDIALLIPMVETFWAVFFGLYICLHLLFAF